MDITPDRLPYIQRLAADWYGNKVAEVAMLRLDVVHKHVSGNKWYKLKHNIGYCIKNGINCILTFGGAYSNHLAATAAMAHLTGMRSVGVVRGHFDGKLTSTLQFCIEQGMALHFLSYEEYGRRNDEQVLAGLSAQYPEAFIIPEGGANEYGRKGTAEIAALAPAQYTHVAVSVGTGSTLAGLVAALPVTAKVIGFAPMKGGRYLEDEVAEWVGSGNRGKYQVYDDWHFGGFGMHTDELIDFMNDFYTTHGIILDKVYTAKMMYGLREQLLSGVYPPDSSILCIHTGGLQGNMPIAAKLVYATGQ